MLQEVKERARELVVAGRLTKAVDELLLRLRDDTGLYNDLLLLQARLNDLDNRKRKGTLTPDQERAERTTISESALAYISRLEDSDLRNKERVRAPFHDWHRYTCDRMPQNTQFKKSIRAKEAQKALFYYIYGLDRHSHYGLVQRFSYDLQGLLKSHINPNLKARCKVERSDIIPVIQHQDEEENKVEVLTYLFAEFGLHAADHEPLLERDLCYLWQHSPILKTLSEEDQVCCYLVISEIDWDTEITPKVVRWLIDDFCGSSLPPEAPSFFFFFGIEFEDEQSAVRQEVETAIRAGGRVHMLEELQMVNRRDIQRWFTTYRKFLQETALRRRKMEEICGDEEEFYMEDVEASLEKLIEELYK